MGMTSMVQCSCLVMIDRDLSSILSIHRPMKIRIILLLMLTLSPIFSARGDGCVFQYWEVIPSSTTCDVYNLPDFKFRALPPSKNSPDHIKRFCGRYEVITKFGLQEVGYCYTGKGDPVGPTFRLAHPDSHQRPKNQSTLYLADLHFEGCNKGAYAKGVVFAPGGWSHAPSYIKRSWPLAQKLAKCE